jgi:hypothetical protein
VNQTSHEGSGDPDEGSDDPDRPVNQTSSEQGSRAPEANEETIKRQDEEQLLENLTEKVQVLNERIERELGRLLPQYVKVYANLRFEQGSDILVGPIMLLSWAGPIIMAAAKDQAAKDLARLVSGAVSRAMNYVFTLVSAPLSRIFGVNELTSEPQPDVSNTLIAPPETPPVSDQQAAPVTNQTARSQSGSTTQPKVDETRLDETRQKLEEIRQKIDETRQTVSETRQKVDEMRPMLDNVRQKAEALPQKADAKQLNDVQQQIKLLAGVVGLVFLVFLILVAGHFFTIQLRTAAPERPVSSPTASPAAMASPTAVPTPTTHGFRFGEPSLPDRGRLVRASPADCSSFRLS